MVSRDDITEFEADLSVRLPDGYRAFLDHDHRIEGRFGDAYLVLWSALEAKELNASYGLRDDAEGLVLIGSNGAGEAVALDLRAGAERVVLIPFISSGWDDAVQQASSFAEFMGQRERGEPFLINPAAE
jgi:hypothetical protein